MIKFSDIINNHISLIVYDCTDIYRSCGEVSKLKPEAISSGISAVIFFINRNC